MKQQHFFGLVLMIVVFWGCSGHNPTAETESPFEHHFHAQGAIDSLAQNRVSVVKKVITAGEEDVVELTPDSSQWKKELESFREAANFNSLPNKDKYSHCKLKMPVSGLVEHRYSANNRDETVQEAVFLYRGNDLEEVRFIVRQDNPVYSFSRKLVYRPESGYRIDSELSILNFVAQQFSVRAAFLSEPKALTLQFDIGDEILPVRTLWSDDRIEVVNGSDRTVLNPQKADGRYKAVFPVFNSVLFINDLKNPKGFWRNYDRGADYEIVFDSEPRFINGTLSSKDFSGKYETYFIHEGDSTRAVGVLEQSGTRLFGTFMTKTGDYRHLEGIIEGDSFIVSTFDGAFAYLFKGRFSGDEFEGEFYSGNHYRAKMYGYLNSDADLADAEGLTHLNPGYSTLEFAFKNSAGKRVSLSDDRFQDKPVLITIMGTWCPNCKDESLFLKQLHEQYHDRGLEIVDWLLNEALILKMPKSWWTKRLQTLNCLMIF